MKRMNYILSIFCIMLLSYIPMHAQSGPFLEELYEVNVETDITYGINATILPVLFQLSSEAVPEELKMDVYSPMGDTNGERPLMLILHTGNFLPFPQNNGTGGTKSDSTIVEIANRLASRGYVVASLDYRLGWNPLAPSQDERKFFLINAAYRGVQDARTAIRYFRKMAVDGQNPFNIDVDKVGVFGIGTGGYITSAMNTLREYNEILLPKFTIDLGGGPLPMILEGVNGDINGTSVGIVPPGYPVLPAGDTLCYPNHVTYENGSNISSDIQFCVNLGGALGDESWLDGDEAPWVSCHVPSDPFAPYTEGIVTVPGTGDPEDPTDDFKVIEVIGSYNIQSILNNMGINDDFSADIAFEDYRDVANARNDGFEGLFPFPNIALSNSSPWDFYAADNPNVPPNPMPQPELAKTYLDTILAYTAPRACIALNLECTGVTNVNDIITEQIGMKISPNPAQSEFVISTNDNSLIRQVDVYDINGRLIRTISGVNLETVSIERRHISNGVYYIKALFDEGIGIKQVIFN